ncbi:hypothetical protein GCM10010505_12870 [Kitasatospora aburaviensis]
MGGAWDGWYVGRVVRFGPRVVRDGSCTGQVGRERVGADLGVAGAAVPSGPPRLSAEPDPAGRRGSGANVRP